MAVAQAEISELLILNIQNKDFSNNAGKFNIPASYLDIPEGPP
ncbi:hypothetical protein [Achromobacter sp. Marseille-Q0513]|nr:hypothetical protein [Achromobacter sp. Marseille-Q0513]